MNCIIAKIVAMKTCVTLALFMLSIQVFGQAGKDFNTYYKSGKLQVKWKYDKQCNCDKATEYYESGKVRNTKTYKLIGAIGTQVDGADISYFENGTIQYYSFWKDGVPYGRTYCNFPDGKLAYEKFYANGYKTGIWKIYNQQGELKQERVYIEGKTPWDSNDDYTTDRFYLNNKLAYVVELVAGKSGKVTIDDRDLYDKLTASEQPSGQKLFIANCGMCHRAIADAVGPKMKGVTERRTIDWLTKMITNGDALLKSGDKDAAALYEKWGKMEHPNFEKLSDYEVVAIIDYLKGLK